MSVSAPDYSLPIRPESTLGCDFYALNCVNDHAVGGALTVTGASTLTGNVTASGNLAVTGNITQSGTGTKTITYTGATGTADAIAGNSMTTAKLLSITATSVGYTSGNLLNLGLTSSGTLAARTGAGLNYAASMTHTADTDVTQNFNDFAIARTVVRNTGGADTHTTLSQGALLALSNTVTATTGTVTDTVKGLSVSMASGGTGDAVSVTHAATGGIAVNVSGAATTVDDVLITGSGAKASAKGTLRVTNSGATAAGGAVLAVTATGTPAAATSYLAAFDYTGATFTNNPIGVLLASGGTNAALNITSSGATAAGTGVVQITAASNAAGIGLKFVLAGLTTGAAIDTTAIAATKQNINMNASTGSTAAPQTNAPAGFFKIGIGGTDQWVPYYNAT